jgi:hypothetical protein
MASCAFERSLYCGLGIHQPYGSYMPGMFAIHSSTAAPNVDKHLQQLKVPRLGTYGDPYELGSPILYVQTLMDLTSSPGTGRAKLPEQILEAIQTLGSPRVRIYVLLQTYLPPHSCAHFACNSTDEVSMVPHMALFGGESLNREAFHCTVAMGLFNPFGVVETHQCIPDSRERGLPFNTLEMRSVSVHDACFSPANAQVRLSHEAGVSSFVTVCHLPGTAPGSRSVFFPSSSQGRPHQQNSVEEVKHIQDLEDEVAVTLHLLPCSEAAERQLVEHIQAHSAEATKRSQTTMQDAIPVLRAIFDAKIVEAGIADDSLPSGLEEASALVRQVLQL